MLFTRTRSLILLIVLLQKSLKLRKTLIVRWLVHPPYYERRNNFLTTNSKFDLFINIQQSDYNSNNNNKSTHLKWHRRKKWHHERRYIQSEFVYKNFCTQLRIYLAHSYTHMCRLPIRFFADKFSWSTRKSSSLCFVHLVENENLWLNASITSLSYCRSYFQFATLTLQLLLSVGALGKILYGFGAHVIFFCCF